MTINDLLSNAHYRSNQTLLAKDLKVNRGTLRKYMTDEKGESHMIIKIGKSYILFAKLSGATHTQLVNKANK